MTPGAIGAATLPAVSAQWRTEVQKRGRFWQWRRGSHQNRQARYGGKFELLTEERQAQYGENAKRYAERNGTSAQDPSPDNGTRGVTTLGERGELLPVGGLECASRERR